jgi:hypothetical protein
VVLPLRVVDPAATPVPPAASPRFVRPDIVELTHGLVTLFGPATPIMGLTPALLISVEPSGIVPPLRVELTLLPGVESGDAVPVVPMLGDDVQPDADVVDPPIDDVEPVIDEPDALVPTPPPSNVELVIVVPEPVVPVPEMPIADRPDDNPVEQFALGTALKPPGSISFAPSGMPEMLDVLEAVEPGMPSGEVAGMPGDVVVLFIVCAWAMSQLNDIAITRNKRRRIGAFSRAVGRIFRIGSAPSSRVTRRGSGAAARAPTSSERPAPPAW